MAREKPSKSLRKPSGKKEVVLFKKQIWLTKAYRKAQKAREAFLKSRCKPTQYELHLFKVLEKTIHDNFKKDNKIQKFRLEDFDQFLDETDIYPRPDTIFIYGKKNIGKTWALAREVTKMRNRNPKAQFVFIRNMKQETDGAEKLFEDEIWPVKRVGNHLYWKDEISDGRKKDIVPAGIFTHTTEGGFQKWQGGSYENVELIIWDECNDIGGSGLNSETLYKFHIFCSSIIRDKTNVRKFMFGNLLSKDDDSMNMFLSRLSLPRDTKFKLIDVHRDNNPKNEVVSRLMYVNTGNWYKGIESQKGLPTQFLTDDESESLLENIPKSLMSKCVYSEYEFIRLLPLYAIIYNIDEEKLRRSFILYFAKEFGQPVFAIWIDQFNKFRIKPGYKPLTNDEGISGDYVAPIFIKSVPYYKLIKQIYNLLQRGQIYYGYNDTWQNFGELRKKHWDQIYKRGNPNRRMQLGYNK